MPTIEESPTTTTTTTTMATAKTTIATSAPNILSTVSTTSSSIITTPATTSTTPSPSTVCEASVSIVNGKAVGCKNSIIFNEDFNSDNLSYWSFDTRFSLDDSSADAEFNVYEKRPETSFVRDNMFTIKPESLKRLSGFDDTRIRIGSYNLKQG
jgi:CCR4-NOT transcriptional regulation complex NOT5 subunit